MYMLVLTVGLMRMLLSGPIDTPEGLTMATMSGVLIGLGAFAIWTLMQERRIARTLMIVFFSISGVLSLLGFLTQLAMPGADPFDLIASVRGAAVATAAIGYFLRSLRVKLTLVN
jgi:predicted membrane channel-forming protein YqfA (hemolysin III family)